MPRQKLLPQRLHRRCSADTDDLAMPSDTAHDADDQQDHPHSPTLDAAAYDTLQMPAVQAYGQDEVDLVAELERPAKRKSGPWNDVGLDSTEPEMHEKRQIRKERQRRPPKKPAARKRPRKVRLRPQVQDVSEKQQTESNRAIPGTSSSRKPKQPRPLKERSRRVVSMPEHGEDSLPEPASSPVPVTRACRRSNALAQLGTEFVSEREGDVSLGERAHVQKRRRPNSMLPVRQVCAISNDEEEEEVVVCLPNAANRQGRRVIGNAEGPPRRELKPGGAAAFSEPLDSDSSKGEKETLAERPVEARTGPAKRKRPPSNTGTSARHIVSNPGSAGIGFGTSRKSAPVACGDVLRVRGELQVVAAKERKVVSLLGRKGEKRQVARLNGNLFQMMPTKSSDSDREKSGKWAGRPGNVARKALDITKKVKESIIQKEREEAPVDAFEEEFLNTPSIGPAGRKSSEEPSKQSSKVAAPGNGLSQPLPPNELGGVGKCGKDLERERVFANEMDPEVMKEIEGATCVVCLGLEDGDKLVLCDSCCAGCHIFCMRPKRRSVPLGIWLCPDCHQTAQRHEMHLSQMVKLRWHLQCLECTRRNDPDVELDCDKSCADCRIAFHSDCLRRYRKVTAAQLKDPEWKCSVCASLTDMGKSIENVTAEAKDPPAVERTTVKGKEQIVFDAKGTTKRTPLEPNDMSAECALGGVRGSLTQAQSRKAPVIPEGVLRKFKRTPSNGRPKTEPKNRATLVVPDKSLKTFERRPGDRRAVSPGIANREFPTKFPYSCPEEEGMEEDVVLDGSGLSGTPIAQRFAGTNHRNIASPFDTRRVTSLFRVAGTGKNSDSDLFKQRKSSLSPPLMNVKQGDRDSTHVRKGSPVAMRRINFHASRNGFGSSKPYGDVKSKPVVRDAAIFSDAAERRGSLGGKFRDEEVDELFYRCDALGSPSLKDEEILDGGFAV